jgi:tRNA (adenine37-N6)-methyltransferase
MWSQTCGTAALGCDRCSRQVDNAEMKTIHLEPIGHVVSDIETQRDEQWGNIVAEIRLDEAQFQPTAFDGLREFSHVEVLFHLDQVAASDVETKTRHPRENPKWPKVGIFAQRGRKRPNRIGATICEIVSVTGLSLRVRGLDALNGSPVLDIKPVMAEFLPEKKTVRQPQWSRELMSTYF